MVVLKIIWRHHGSAVDFFGTSQQPFVVFVNLSLFLCLFLYICQLVLDLILAEGSGGQKGVAAVFVGFLNLSNAVLQVFLLVLDPLFQRAELILEDCGSRLFNFLSHALFPLVDLVGLVGALD